MANFSIYRKATRARKNHGPCGACGEDILIDQELVTVREFDPTTKQSGRTWKRHSGCPMGEVEYSRLSDKAG